MLKRVKMKRASKIQLVIAFLAIATAMSTSAFAQTTKTQIQRMNPWSTATPVQAPVAQAHRHPSPPPLE